MLPLIMAAIGAASAVAGAVTTHAANEKNRQAVKRYEKVNAELINSRDRLQKQYYELSDRSKQQINNLNLKLAESEMEKDLVYLALSLYHELMALREDIDINPSFEVLVEFHKAIILTNYVLKQLGRHLVPVSQDYFSRTLHRIDERNNLSKEQLFSFMAILMNPQQDTVTSLLGEVQNEIFSQPFLESEDTFQHQSNHTYELTSMESKSVNYNCGESWFLQGKKFIELKDYKQALVYFEKATAINPNNSEYWYWRGRVLFSLDKYKAFIYSLDRAIAIAPENDEYRDWRGKVYCVDT